MTNEELKKLQELEDAFANVYAAALNAMKKLNVSRQGPDFEELQHVLARYNDLFTTVHDLKPRT